MKSESCSVISDSLRPCGLYSPWNSLGQNTGVGSLSLLQGTFPTQGANSGHPKNTGVGSLSLLQGIFPTQESNPGLLHCRWILDQLSYQGSPELNCWIKMQSSSQLRVNNPINTAKLEGTSSAYDNMPSDNLNE